MCHQFETSPPSLQNPYPIHVSCSSPTAARLRPSECATLAFASLKNKQQFCLRYLNTVVMTSFWALILTLNMPNTSTVPLNSSISSFLCVLLLTHPSCTLATLTTFVCQQALLATSPYSFKNRTYSELPFDIQCHCASYNVTIVGNRTVSLSST